MDNTQELTLMHYKEPLKTVKEGYGYLGALSCTMNGDKIQCHICGSLFSSLSLHVYQTHKMPVKEYREKFDLAYTTSLVSETERQKLKYRTLAWLSSLTDEQKQEWKMKRKENYRVWLEKKHDHIQPASIRLETYNKRGTCPDQLLAKIKEVAKKLGTTPTLSEFIQVTGTQRYKHLIFKVYGSWKNALKVIKMEPRQRKSLKGKSLHRYSDEELLEYLSLYAQENNKVPTFTDCKRGLIPSDATYTNRFGTLEKARRLAGVYDFVPRSSLRGVI